MNKNNKDKRITNEVHFTKKTKKRNEKYLTNIRQE